MLCVFTVCVGVQHDDSEYGEAVGPDGRHQGGPFQIQVAPKMRVTDLRLLIRVCMMWLSPSLVAMDDALPVIEGGSCCPAESGAAVVA